MENKGVSLPVLIKRTDWVAGKETGIVYKIVNPTGDWSLYLPVEEEQEIYIGGIKYETGGCTNFAWLNCIETFANFMLKNNMIKPENVKKLTDWGYIENGRFNFSDRHLYKITGTTQQGNQIIFSPDFASALGLVPEKMWPQTGLENFAKWTAPIPKEVADFAKNFLSIFEIQYEWVVVGQCGAPDLDLLEKHLKQAPLDVAHQYCGPDANGTLQICQVGCQTQHATMVYNVDRANKVIRDFESVFPSKKKFALNYPLVWALKTILVEKEPAPKPVLPPFEHAFYEDLKFGQRSIEIKWLQKAYVRLGYKIPMDDLPTGYFGYWTRAANEQFQKENGVWNPWIFWYDQSKYFGPKTKAALNKKLNELAN